MGGDNNDELAERMSNFLFTLGEVVELAMQGVKPWDDDAGVSIPSFVSTAPNSLTLQLAGHAFCSLGLLIVPGFSSFPYIYYASYLIIMHCFVIYGRDESSQLDTCRS